MDVQGVPNSTSVQYWDNVADDWQSEIQDSLNENRDRVIYRALDEFVLGADAVLDLGCGVGNYLLALSVRARQVFGADISPRCVEVARQLCERRRLSNCHLHVADLARERLEDAPDFLPGPMSVVICMNVIISPDPITRHEILATAYRALQPPSAATDGAAGGGVLLLVAPAVESVQLVRQRRRALAEAKGRRSRPPRVNEADEAEGIFRRAGVRTKHFAEAELSETLARLGFSVLRFDRVCYDWDSELPGAGRLGGPQPFDWLAVSRRISAEPQPPGAAPDGTAAGTAGGGGPEGQKGAVDAAATADPGFDCRAGVAGDSKPIGDEG